MNVRDQVKLIMKSRAPLGSMGHNKLSLEAEAIIEVQQQVYDKIGQLESALQNRHASESTTDGA